MLRKYGKIYQESTKFKVDNGECQDHWTYSPGWREEDMSLKNIKQIGGGY